MKKKRGRIRVRLDENPRDPPEKQAKSDNYRMRLDGAKGTIYIGQRKTTRKRLSEEGSDKGRLFKTDTQSREETVTGNIPTRKRNRRALLGPDNDPKGYFKTKVNNGKALFLEHVDGRTMRARRFRETFRSLVHQLGGNDEITPAQRHMCRRAAGLTVMAEELEAHWAAATGHFSLLEYVTIAKTERSVLALIGVERRIKTLNPADKSLGEYIDAEYKDDEEEEDE